MARWRVEFFHRVPPDFNIEYAPLGVPTKLDVSMTARTY
jgi:hypothetical protein